MKNMQILLRSCLTLTAFLTADNLSANESAPYSLITKNCSSSRCGNSGNCPGGIYTNTLGQSVDFTNENCLSCHESKNKKKVKIKTNATCISHKKLCELLANFNVNSYAPVIYPDQLVLTQDPPFNPPLPPGLPGDFPPPVVNNPISVVGKNVVVIGGSRGVGKGIADRFYAEGANVIATSRYPECYEKRPYPLQRLDIRYEDNVSHFMEKLIKKIKKIDILIIVAGTYWNGPIQVATGDEIMSHFNATVFGWHRVVHRALPYMRHSNDTRVISIASQAAYLSIGYDLGAYVMQQISKERWNDVLQAEEMLNKARGVTQYGPTFTLFQMGAVTTTLGSYEYFHAKAVKPSSPANSVAVSLGSYAMILGGFQAITTSPIPGEAVFRVATAPQPGIRYLLYDNTAPSSLVEFIQLSNTVSANTSLNVLNSIFTPIIAPANLQLIKDELIGEICPNCN